MFKSSRRYWVLFSATGINLFAGLIYIWSIVSKGLVEQFHWTSTQASLPYTIASIFLVLASVAAGQVQDKKGPKISATIAGILIGLGLILSSLTREPIMIILTFGIITGTGFGFSNISVLPPALKWFPPEKKGFITGIVAGGIAFSSAIYSPLIVYLINNFGISSSFLIIGIAVFFLIILLAQILRNPPAEYMELIGRQNATQQKSVETHSYKWRQAIKKSEFYIIWAMLGLSSSAGLMIIGHATEIAKCQAGWDGGFFLVILIAVFNCIGRIAGGRLSDKVGRIRYIRWVILIQAINIPLFCLYGSIPLLCMGAAVTGICYGSVIAVVPAITADYFGMQHFGVNYGLIFTAWGVGGIIGPMTAAAIFDSAGSYNIAYLICCVLLIAALIISFKLKKQINDSVSSLTNSFYAKEL